TVPARPSHADLAKSRSSAAGAAWRRALREAAARAVARVRHRAVRGAEGHVGDEGPRGGGRLAVGAGCADRRRAGRSARRAIERQGGYRKRSGRSWVEFGTTEYTPKSVTPAFLSTSSSM